MIGAALASPAEGFHLRAVPSGERRKRTTMKRIAAAIILLGALGTAISSRQAQAEVNVTVSIGGFYDSLSPYGEWIDCSYGECWVPGGVPTGWQPYTNGEWIYTRYGWTWVSSDRWGGDTYHYGTWAFVGRYGWVWVPGTVWAPAWVTWSYSDSYVGWAPMPPNIAFGRSGYSGRAVVVNESQYVFVPTGRFVGTNVNSVRMEPRRNAEFMRTAKPVTRFGVSGGIVTNVALPMATVQRAMGGKVATHEITSARTTPRTVTSGTVGKAGHVGIVAPAGDVKAAHASHQVAKPPQQEQAKSPQALQQQAKQQEAKQQGQAKQQQQAQQQQAKQQEAKPQGQAKQQQQAQQQHAKQQEAKQQGQAKQQQQAQQQHAKQQEAKQQGQAKQQQAKQQEAKQQEAKQQGQAKQQQQAQQQEAKQQGQAKQQQQAQQQQAQQQEAKPQQARPPQQPPKQQQQGQLDPHARPAQAPAAQPPQPQQSHERAGPPGQAPGKDQGQGQDKKGQPGG